MNNAGSITDSRMASRGNHQLTPLEGRNLDPQELQANCMSANNFQDPNISNYRQIV